MQRFERPLLFIIAGDPLHTLLIEFSNSIRKTDKVHIKVKIQPVNLRCNRPRWLQYQPLRHGRSELRQICHLLKPN